MGPPGSVGGQLLGVLAVDAGPEGTLDVAVDVWGADPPLPS